MFKRAKENILGVEKKWALRWFIWRRYRKIFYSIREGDVIIDCGANVGDVTAEFAKRGAVVYAFEPHPRAFEVLEQRFLGNKRVRPLQKAVWVRNEKMKLYMHKEAGFNPVGLSVAASFLSFKDNVSSSNYLEVEAVDLAEFVLSIGKRVKLVKMDVEGIEYDIVFHLIKTGAVKLIDYMLVETHDKKNPALVEKRRVLEREIREGGWSQIDLEWT
jgi:FkbM family methyltransferase